MPDINIIFIAGAGLVALLFVVLAVTKFMGSRSLKYRTVPLFTPAEKNFLNTLDSFGEDFRIFGKVRIADVILPQKRLSKQSWNKLFWQISSKHFDYILCDKVSLEVLCVVELNDRSHEKKARAARDILVEKVCSAAGLPLAWIPASSVYIKDDVMEQINRAIGETDK